MPRPIETLLSLPRVRLFDRVPILETQRLVKRFIERPEYHEKLVKPVLEVSWGSARQFASDDQGLATLLEETRSAAYIVNKHSKKVMEEMLRCICDDGSLFKRFADQIQPLYQLSHNLLEVSRFAGSLADKTKEESIDVARVLMIDLPMHYN